MLVRGLGPASHDGARARLGLARQQVKPGPGVGQCQWARVARESRDLRYGFDGFRAHGFSIVCCKPYPSL